MKKNNLHPNFEEGFTFVFPNSAEILSEGQAAFITLNEIELGEYFSSILLEV